MQPVAISAVTWQLTQVAFSIIILFGNQNPLLGLTCAQTGWSHIRVLNSRNIVTSSDCWAHTQIVVLRDNMSLIGSHTVAIIIIVSQLIRAGNAMPKDTLHLGVLVSQEGDFDFSGYLPAMDISLETINNDPTLPFNFSVTVNNSMVRNNDGSGWSQSYRARANEWLDMSAPERSLYRYSYVYS